jgi:hypothetical protein
VRASARPIQIIPCLSPFLVTAIAAAQKRDVTGRRGTYGDFKIHHLLRKRAHFIVEAKAILAGVIRREDKVALALFCAVEDDFVRGADDAVVDVEGAAGLDLGGGLASLITPCDATLREREDWKRELQRELQCPITIIQRTAK